MFNHHMNRREAKCDERVMKDLFTIVKRKINMILLLFSMTVRMLPSACFVLLLLFFKLLLFFIIFFIQETKFCRIL